MTERLDSLVIDGLVGRAGRKLGSNDGAQNPYAAPRLRACLEAVVGGLR